LILRNLGKLKLDKDGINMANYKAIHFIDMRNIFETFIKTFMKLIKRKIFVNVDKILLLKLRK